MTNRGKTLIVLALSVFFTAAVVVVFRRGNDDSENPFALTIGPRTLAPIPECVPMQVTKSEFVSVVNSLVRHEQWFGSLPHAEFRYSVDVTNHPPMIKQMRDDLQRQFPELELTAEAFPYLVPKTATDHTIAFDAIRFAFSKQSTVEEFSQSMVWDGSVATGVAGPDDAPRNYFLLGSREECAQRSFESFPIIGHAGSSYYKDLFASIKDERPEISAATWWEGRECLVLETWNDDWIIDRADLRVYARVGYHASHTFSNHQEVADGVFWPMKMTYRRYTDEGDLKREVITNIHRFETVEAPQEAAFQQNLITGIEVHDLRHTTPIRYAYDPNRTNEEWDEINAKLRANEQRDRSREEERRSMLGQRAPEFGSGRWLNSAPLSVDRLQRRGAEIGFVGVGCAPCDNILPSFATKPDPNEPLKILVFNCRDTDAEIRRKLAPYKVTCPVFVPNTSEKHPWGDLYAEYRIRGMPTTVALDGNGVIDSYREGVFLDE